MPDNIPPPPLSSTPRPPRSPDVHEDRKPAPPPLKPRPKSIDRKRKPPPVRPRPKSIDHKNGAARRGSVVTYTKGRRTSAETYSRSALKETFVRPSANLYAITSRRHLDVSGQQNENKGEASMGIQLSASLPVRSVKIITRRPLLTESRIHHLYEVFT